MAGINSQWNPNSDIYGIVDSIDGVHRQLIDDESETTLALGIFGFLTDTEAKKIQTAIIMAGELGNEMFAGRAKLDKNVLTHAIYSSIQNINATPATITLTIGLRINDLESYFINNQFIIDSETPIYVGSYEFHLDYDVIINRAKNTLSGDTSAPDAYSYMAQYKMLDDDGEIIENRLSKVRSQYIMQPFVMMIDNYWYILFQVTLHQYTIERTVDRLVTDSIIANKTFVFEFENQIADFDVYVTDNGVTTKLIPVLYGSDPGKIEYYCWYIFLDDHTIRVTFEGLSYLPGLNSDIEVVAYTTLGESGNFEYTKIDNTSEGFYFDNSSTKYNYNKITCFGLAVTDSLYGADRKDKKTLQKLLPKASMARGSLTTEKDVSNYFNLIEDENNRLVLQKKVDNQLTRIWYAYFLLKDDLGNIIPTNTIKLHIDLKSSYWHKSPDGRIVIPAGSGIIYNRNTAIGEIIDVADIPNPIDNDSFYGDDYYYVTVYQLILCRDPLYSAFYMTAVDEVTFFKFHWVNVNAPTQFVTNRVAYRRNLLTDQDLYKIKFSIAQSLLINYGMYIENAESIDTYDAEGNEIHETIIERTINIKVILVLFDSYNEPYRWKECTFDYSKYENDNNYRYDFYVDLMTDNGLDDKNRIKINDMYIAGSNKDKNYGYFDPETNARIYILGRFDEETHDPKERGIGDDCLDNIAPGYDDFIVANIYDFEEPIQFFENYTDVIDAKVDSLDEEGLNFNVSGVPVVGGQYINIDFDEAEDNAAYMFDAISEKKAYIDYCLELLENNMDVDFKFFNTYGPSLTYLTEDGENINHVDLQLKFEVSLKSTTDVRTKDLIIQFVKDYIEDLYDTGDLHIPNLITEITNQFNDTINYIEFISFNGFGEEVQHIIEQDVDDPTTVPEFLSIRNMFREDAKNLEPCIEIVTV